MRILHRYVLISFVPIFFLSLLVMVMIILLFDSVPNLQRYFSAEAEPAAILQVYIYYVPFATRLGLPLALLFASSLTLANMNTNKELLAAYGTGQSLLWITLPFIILGLLISAVNFYLEDSWVVPNLRLKNSLSRELLGQETQFSTGNIALIAQEGRAIYYADYYNHHIRTLSRTIFLERNEDYRIIRRIDGEWANWEGSWTINKARIFTFDPITQDVTETYSEQLVEPFFDEEPDSFFRSSIPVDELTRNEAWDHIQNLQAVGLPFREALTSFHQRLSISMIPLLVMLISSALGSRFRKNIRILTIFSTASLVVVYYIFQMMTVIMGKSGSLSPFWGAWLPFLLFTLIGFSLILTSKS